MISQDIKFDVGIRFQPLGVPTETSEVDIRKAHWQLVFTPSHVAETSLTVELAASPNGDLSFPVFEWPEKRYAHPIGTWTGPLKGIHEFIAMHPMRGTKYSTAYKNCQHWAATFLILMQAAGQLEVVHHSRHCECLAALVQIGTRLYHRSNRFLGNLHLLGIGGGAAAWGAAAVAAEATTLVPAWGVFGWIGFTAAVPTAMATVATVALPFTAVAAAGAVGTYFYKGHYWMNKTMFDDPRTHGYPSNKTPLSRKEKGEFLGGQVVGSLQSSSASSETCAKLLLGSGTGVYVGALSAAVAPGAAAVLAPSAAVAISSALDTAVQEFS